MIGYKFLFSCFVVFYVCVLMEHPIALSNLWHFLKVIPVMALMVGCLGENLREISNRAHLSVASLSAYLNEVWYNLAGIRFIHVNGLIWLVYTLMTMLIPLS